ncbi:MAG: hypothetical protein WC373_05670 [Smithella sp.]|jgi:hypothetical protein
MKIKKVIENLKGIENVDRNNLYNKIVCAFEDYAYMGVSEIVVSAPNRSEPNKLNAYANHEDAPIVNIYIIENNDGTVSIEDAC